ncbi:hypothetical protein [Marilutibacter maris]|uniref:Transmembrane protein n=1 Tax=Marilutibacter maris TaxID=1605891 RepID=A0A2U9T6R9_9GAMM|nr:hypothetical protein [Lysobacter maris]AWV06198.1 hypothetical protein C9I47_0474 [Lysobacter maris]KAB8198388.1 hypothetical protein FKV24_002325 [Lysobacter maris]
MNAAPEPLSTPPASPSHRRTRWLYLGAAVCVTAWLALGTGLAIGVGRTALIVLTTAAALTTEGMIWLTALVLGVNVYSARRQLWQKLRQRLR